MRILAFEHQLRFAQCPCSWLPCQDTLIIVYHQLLRLPVWYLPQAHHQRLHPRKREGAPEPEDTLTHLHLTQPSAGRQHYQLSVQQI